MKYVVINNNRLLIWNKYITYDIVIYYDNRILLNNIRNIFRRLNWFVK